MKRLLFVGLMIVALGIVYTSVYACDRSANATVVKSSTNGKTTRTMVIGATTRCETAEASDIMSFDIDVPGRTSPRFVHIVACEKPGNPGAVRTAITLGRAFVTAIEAVMGSLLNAASEKTAALV
jgi:hypothetical protein